MKKLSHKARWASIYVIAAAACFLVIANTIASQELPSLFYSYIEGGRGAVVSYLSRIKTLPFFRSELIRYKNEYGAGIQDEVFKEDVQRKKEIDAIQAVLKKQPYSRDLLYSLSLLYKEDGNDEQAALYLKKAKEIDPSIPN